MDGFDIRWLSFWVKILTFIAIGFFVAGILNLGLPMGVCMFGCSMSLIGAVIFEWERRVRIKRYQEKGDSDT